MYPSIGVVEKNIPPAQQLLAYTNPLWTAGVIVEATPAEQD